MRYAFLLFLWLLMLTWLIEGDKLLKKLKIYRRVILICYWWYKRNWSAICMPKILLEENSISTIKNRRRLNPNMKEVFKKEILKLLDAGIIYHISNSRWISLVHVVHKKGGMTVVKNENNDLIPIRTVTWWRMCIDYRKLNSAIRKTTLLFHLFTKYLKG